MTELVQSTSDRKKTEMKRPVDLCFPWITEVKSQARTRAREAPQPRKSKSMMEMCCDGGLLTHFLTRP